MLNRLLVLPRNQSLFLFGARNTGKSTWIAHSFARTESLWVDLLNPVEEALYINHPEALEQNVLALFADIKYVVIDEIQKAPKLLDVVHRLIEATDKRFILTGSSARKLKRGAANMLAGRALTYHLYPFSVLELKASFSLEVALHYGLLPYVYQLNDATQRKRFLSTYANTYLKEEVWSEQLVKKLDPFRKFLAVAAQQNGKVINFARIARDVLVSDQTVMQYYQILEDTLVGFYLEAFHSSVRKRLSHKPKFYFFDPGVVRALTLSLNVPLNPGTSAYGEAFEHLVILECIKLADIYFLQYRFSYLATKDGAEIDLIVERPGQPLLLIEVKSSTYFPMEKLTTLKQFAQDLQAEAICLCNEPHARESEGIKIYPWLVGIQQFFVPVINDAIGL